MFNNINVLWEMHTCCTDYINIYSQNSHKTQREAKKENIVLALPTFSKG